MCPVRHILRNSVLFRLHLHNIPVDLFIDKYFTADILKRSFNIAFDTTICPSQIRNWWVDASVCATVQVYLYKRQNRFRNHKTFQLNAKNIIKCALPFWAAVIENALRPHTIPNHFNVKRNQMTNALPIEIDGIILPFSLHNTCTRIANFIRTIFNDKRDKKRFVSASNAVFELCVLDNSQLI